jgi:hypothetical protein
MGTQEIQEIQLPLGFVSLFCQEQLFATVRNKKLPKLNAEFALLQHKIFTTPSSPSCSGRCQLIRHFHSDKSHVTEEVLENDVN